MKISHKIIKFFTLWVPPILWAFLIFTFSSFPTIETLKIDWQDFIVKKIAHMVEYGILSLLIFRLLLGNKVDRKKTFYLSIVLAAFYGLTDEFHQSFTPGREPRVRDVLFDTIGATLVSYYLWKLLPKAPRKVLNLGEKLGLR